MINLRLVFFKTEIMQSGKVDKHLSTEANKQQKKKSIHISLVFGEATPMSRAKQCKYECVFMQVVADVKKHQCPQGGPQTRAYCITIHWLLTALVT